MIACFKVNEDTVYVDDVRSIYWAYGSYDGCKLRYDEISDSLRDELEIYYDLDSGATLSERERFFYEPIPGLFSITAGNRIFTYVNQSTRIVRGAFGMFFPGNDSLPPFNVFGYGLDYCTESELFDFVKGLEDQEKVPPIRPLPTGFPSHWTALDSIPISASPDYPAASCLVPSLDHASLSQPMARFLVGDDTLYVDEVRSFYWGYGSHSGCKLLYQEITDSLRQALNTYYDLDSGATIPNRDRHFYRAFPTLTPVRIGNREFMYVYQATYPVRGATGMFFAGNDSLPPFNIYGYGLGHCPIREIKLFLEGFD